MSFFFILLVSSHVSEAWGTLWPIPWLPTYDKYTVHVRRFRNWMTGKFDNVVTINKNTILLRHINKQNTILSCQIGSYH